MCVYTHTSTYRYTHTEIILCIYVPTRALGEATRNLSNLLKASTRGQAKRFEPGSSPIGIRVVLAFLGLRAGV